MFANQKISEQTGNISTDNTHVYFDEDKYYNSEPFQNVSDIDGSQIDSMNEVISCGKIHDIEEWITVERRKQKRANKKKGKAKAYLSDYPISQPLTRSKYRLMHHYSNIGRIPNKSTL